MEVDQGSLAMIRRGLTDLAELLRGVRLSLPIEGHDGFERERGQIVGTIEDYLLGRLDALDAPVVAAVVGPGGTGKSTLVNSLAQDHIAEVGAVRPTTTAPVLWANRERAGAYWGGFLNRVRDRVGPGIELVVGDDPLTTHLTIVDTPPVDYAGRHGALTTRDVLALSDICVFVTSPARYADAVGWEFVRDARTRGVPTLFVLNRLPSDDRIAASLLDDLAARLHARGLLLEPDPAYIFGVAEGDVSQWHGGLEPAAVGALRKELGELADEEFRNALMTQTAFTTTVSLADRAEALVDAFAAEAKSIATLTETAALVYEDEIDRLLEDLASGVMAGVADRIVWSQAVADLAAVTTRRAGVAAQRVADYWAEDQAGAVFLEREGEGLWRHGETTGSAVVAALEAFERQALELVEAQLRGGIWRRAAMRRGFDDAWRAALDPHRRETRGAQRRFGDDLAALAAELRDGIAQALGEQLRADGERFERHLAMPPSPELPDAIAAAAERVRALALAAVPTALRVADTAGVEIDLRDGAADDIELVADA